MLRLSVGALRTRWQLFAGAVVAVALGVGLVLSGLQMLAATDRPVLPAGLSAFERAKVREGYELGRGTGITRSGHVKTLHENRSTALVQ